MSQNRSGRGILPRIWPLFLLLFRSAGFHMVKDPVPHDEETGDDHLGEEAGAEEGTDQDDLVLHRGRLMQGQ